MKIANLVIPIALLFPGCANVPGLVAKRIPDGTWKSVDFTTTVSGYGSASVHMTDVYKSGTTIESGSYNATLSSPFQPIVTIAATGFTPAQVAAKKAQETKGP